MSQMLPAPATIDPSELPIVGRMVAVTAPVLTSTRDSVLSPQLGTQTLPNATARPEQGPLPVATGVPIAFVCGSIFATLPFGAFDTHAAASIASQSGVPGHGKTASVVRRS